MALDHDQISVSFSELIGRSRSRSDFVRSESESAKIGSALGSPVPTYSKQLACS